MNNDLKYSAINGAKWITTSTVVDAIIQILKMSILARFVTKADFGVVAILNIVTGLTLIFADLGFSVGILSQRKITEKQFSSIFWIQAFFFLFLYIVLSALSSIISSYYEEPALKTYIPISLISILFWGLGKLYDTVIQKELKFDIIALRNIVSSIISLISVVVCCLLGLKIYSLIISTVIYTATYNIWNFITGQKYFKLRFYISIAESKSFFKIGVYRMGSHIFDYFSDKIDVLIIGKWLGMETLGVYNISKDLLRRAMDIIRSISSKVSSPILASINDSPNQLRSLYKKNVKLVSTIAAPICMCIFCCSDYIITILYGVNYNAASFYIRCFSLLYLFNVILAQEGSLVSACGKTDRAFYWTVIRVAITIPLTVVCSHISLNAVIIGQYVILLISFLYLWRYIIYPICQLKMQDYILSFFCECFISLIVGVIVYCLIKIKLLPITNAIANIFIWVCLFVVIYMFASLMINKKNTLMIIQLLKDVIKIKNKY